jgi:hypothetical protein
MNPSCRKYIPPPEFIKSKSAYDITVADQGLTEVSIPPLQTRSTISNTNFAALAPGCGDVCRALQSTYRRACMQHRGWKAHVTAMLFIPGQSSLPPGAKSHNCNESIGQDMQIHICEHSRNCTTVSIYRDKPAYWPCTYYTYQNKRAYTRLVVSSH